MVSQRWSRLQLLGVTFCFLCIWMPVRYLSLTALEYDAIIHKNDLLDHINLDCSAIFDSNESSIEQLESWKFNPKPIEEVILKEENKCALIKELFEFREKPLSKEEEDFPLAYGLIVHKDIIQVLFMLSSFYHPQNEYCIAVSGSSNPVFKLLIRKLADCFPNIHAMERPRISWGSFEILNSTYACFDYLTSLQNKWKYYQYLSGVDIPLRTNLEMVKILKVFNGTPNMEMKSYQMGRLKGRKMSASPLKLYKSSVSAIVPREAADFIRNSNKTQAVLKFLSKTSIADESFWATVMGNVDVFPAPGGLNAQKIIDFRKHLDSRREKDDDSEQSNLKWSKPAYYLSRYQLWITSRCKGKNVSGSCVFGVRDLATVLKKPHFVSHKFYLDFQPAAYFCALKEIRRRSRNPVPFDTKLYEELPQIELRRGVSFENLTHPDWLLH